MLEDKIYEVCKNQRSQLPEIIKRAKDFPGIKFENKSAKNFIVDCVSITEEYLPLVIYNLIGSDPISKLKGKVTIDEIKDFMKRLDLLPQQALLEVILRDIRNSGMQVKMPKAEKKDKAIDNVYGVYGDYASSSSDEEVTDIELEEATETITSDDLELVQELIINTIGAK